MILTNTFLALTDHRRSQGLRVTQSQVLTMIVVAYVCGHFSYRKIGTFAKAHGDLFTKTLGLKHPIPSFMTFRDVIIHTNQAELIAAFNAWAKEFVPLVPYDWVSGDGKSLRSTVANAPESNQDFQAVVSLFAQKTRIVVLLETYWNKKTSERDVVTVALHSLQDKHL